MNNELTAALATIEKCREITGCQAGVDLQDHLRKLVAERDASLNAERIWEKTMMEVCGEDGPASVANEIRALRGLRDTAMQALKAQVEQLAAENEGLKSSRAILAENALETCNEVYTAGFRNTALHDGLMESTGNRNKYPNPIRTLVDEAKRNIETPATNAAIAGIKADGVEEFIGRLQQCVDDGDFVGDEVAVIVGAIDCGKEFCEQLREGGPNEQVIHRNYPARLV